jgi:hypothetical protein
MVTIRARWADDTLAEFGEDLERLRREFPKVVPREINKVGARAKTLVIRNLTKQTGLDRRVIVAAVDVTMAGGKRLSYGMVTRGGNIRLKYLKPKETQQGVVAKPFGKKTLYPGAFMRGGAFPDRKVVAKFDGHVMFRNRSKGRHYTFARSGVFIPEEMTKGATLAAFERTAGPLLQQRLDAVIRKLLK